MTETIVEWVINFLMGNPHLAVIITIISFARAVFKPTCALIQLYVDSTPGLGDNEKWLALQSNKVFKAVAFVLDYFTSIKLPAPKAPAPKE